MTDTPEPYFQYVPTDKITRDAEVNTSPLSTSKVHTWAAKGFNSAAFGVVLLSKRDDGNYVVLDGQHRLYLIDQTGGFGNGEVPAMIYEGLDRAEEAKIYRIYNFQRTVKTPESEHKAKVTEGDPTALAIDNVLRQYGWDVDHTTFSGRTRATRTLYEIMKRDAERWNMDTMADTPILLTQTIRVLTHAFGNDKSALGHAVLWGVARLISDNYERVRDDRLIETLRFFENPPQLRVKGHSYRSLVGDFVRNDTDAIYHVLVQRYNRKLQAHNRLEAKTN